MTFCYFIVIICELVMVNYCDFHIAVTDVPLCLWNSRAPLAGNTGFICPLSTSASTKQSGWLHNLWATNSVVNRTGYLGPLYASRHQTSLWRRQHIYSVQLLQTAAESASPSIAIVRSFVYKHCVANASDHTAQPAATSSPQWLLNTGESPASGDANTMWFLSAVIQPLIDSKRQRQIGWW